MSLPGEDTPVQDCQQPPLGVGEEPGDLEITEGLQGHLHHIVGQHEGTAGDEGLQFSRFALRPAGDLLAAAAEELPHLGKVGPVLQVVEGGGDVLDGPISHEVFEVDGSQEATVYQHIPRVEVAVQQAQGLRGGEAGKGPLDSVGGSPEEVRAGGGQQRAGAGAEEDLGLLEGVFRRPGDGVGCRLRRLRQFRMRRRCGPRWRGGRQSAAPAGLTPGR